MRHGSGFTLVELAIVITIIGLLIGGVLKGQELLQNARMTTFASQTKSFNAAVTVFKDIYKSIPGDIVNPGTLIEGCSTTWCNISGNGDGLIGTKNEVNAFWLHLGGAKLLSGVKMDATWSAGGSVWEPVSPPTPFGGLYGIANSFSIPSTDWPNGLNGHYVNAMGGSRGFLPLVDLAKIDLKMDDGRPRYGDVMTLNNISGCNVATYDPNSTLVCDLIMKPEF